MFLFFLQCAGLSILSKVLSDSMFLAMASFKAFCVPDNAEYFIRFIKSVLSNGYRGWCWVLGGLGRWLWPKKRDLPALKMLHRIKRLHGGEKPKWLFTKIFRNDLVFSHEALKCLAVYATLSCSG